MGVGKKKVFTDSTKHQRYYAKNKEKRLNQIKERRQIKAWEQAYYRMTHAAKKENHYHRIYNKFSQENFKTFYENNSKGMEHPQVHRLDYDTDFNEKNVVIIERKWFPYIAGKTVEEKKKLIEGFKKGGQ
ncbi:MAG: hypothetical protein HQL12_05810 [Candidatus Omnitrophica bacterium]|nr:hypothetical protein [Candidatus Omnitrophota bacterium]